MIKFYRVKANRAHFYECADKVREAKSERERGNCLQESFPLTLKEKQNNSGEF